VRVKVLTQQNDLFKKTSFWLTAGGLCLIGLIPFNFRPNWVVQVKSFSIPYHHILFSLSGIFLLMFSIATFLRKKTLPLFAILAGSLVFMMTLSSLFSQIDKFESFQTTLGFLFRGIAPGLAAYVLCRFESKDDGFFKTFVILGFLVAFASLFEPLSGKFFIFERKIIDPNIAAHYPPSRGFAVGALGQPLPLSALLVLLLPFSLAGWIRNRKNKFYMISSFVILSAIFMTFRRSGYFLGLWTGFSFLFLSGNIKKGIIYVSIFLVFMAGVCLSSPFARKTIKSRFNISNTIEEIKVSHRTKTYGTVWAIVKKYPVLGIGTRQFYDLHELYSTYEGAIETPDNQYLRFLAEGGVLGFTVFIFFIGFLLSKFFSQRHSLLGRAYWMGLVNFSLVLIILDGLYWPATQMTFWVVIGAGMGRVDLRIKEGS